MASFSCRCPCARGEDVFVTRRRSSHIAARMDQIEAVLKDAGRPLDTSEVCLSFPRQTHVRKTCGHPECTRPEHQVEYLVPYVGLWIGDARPALDALAKEGRIRKLHRGNARSNLWEYLGTKERAEIAALEELLAQS